MPTHDKRKQDSRSTNKKSSPPPTATPRQKLDGEPLHRARLTTDALNVGDVLRLQRAIGNQATQRLIESSAGTNRAAAGTLQRKLDLEHTMGEYLGWREDAKSLLENFEKLKGQVSTVRAQVTPEVAELYEGQVTLLEVFVTELEARKKIPVKEREDLNKQVSTQLQAAATLETAIASTKANDTFAGQVGERAMEGTHSIGKEKVKGRATHLDQFFQGQQRRKKEQAERQETRLRQESERESKKSAREEKHAKAEKGPTDEQVALWQKQSLLGRVEVEYKALQQSILDKAVDVEVTTALTEAQIPERGDAVKNKLATSDPEQLSLTELQGWLDEVTTLQKDLAKAEAKVRARRVQALVKIEQDNQTREQQEEIKGLTGSKHDKKVKKRLQEKIREHKESTKEALTSQFDQLLDYADLETLKSLLQQGSAVEIENLLLTQGVDVGAVKTLLGTSSKEDTVALLKQVPDAALLVNLQALTGSPEELKTLVQEMLQLNQVQAVREHLASAKPAATLDSVKGVLDTERRARGLIAANGIVLEQVTPDTVTGDGKANEKKAIGDALKVLDGEVGAVNDWGGKWGDAFANHDGDLPGVAGAGGYREYYVRRATGDGGWGSRRLVVSSTTGFIYYTWTHYGDNGSPAFVRIR